MHSAMALQPPPPMLHVHLLANGQRIGHEDSGKLIGSIDLVDIFNTVEGMDHIQRAFILKMKLQDSWIEFQFCLVKDRSENK